MALKIVIFNMKELLKFYAINISIHPCNNII
jgi:hypothetical protein